MADLWLELSGTVLATVEEKTTIVIPLPIDISETPNISIISGSLPNGLRLKGYQIEGTPYDVPRSTTSTFVLRAVANGILQDRTFKITINGPDEPVWQTPQDLLNAGAQGHRLFVLDSEIIDYQLEATDEDLAAGQVLEYFIANGDGELPEGLTLSKSGKISGIIDPILALDKLAANGNFDTSSYGVYPYDFSSIASYYYNGELIEDAVFQSPKKLNRYYQFIVSVSDGDTIVKRSFRIYVVGDDFLRADNVLMKAGTGVFTADNTYIRTPTWLTNRDFGYRRAGNYVTLFLNVLNNTTLQGVIVYNVLSLNDDNSPSILPPGMTLDVSTGEIAGRVPYQTAAVTNYRFTIRASLLDPFDITATALAFKDRTFTVKLLGEVDSTISWITQSNVGTIDANFVSTFRIEAATTIPEAPLLYRVVGGRLPPGLVFGQNGEISGSTTQFGDGVISGLTIFDNGDLLLDGNDTTIDRVYRFTVEAKDRFGYSAVTKEFYISVIDQDDRLYSNLFMKPFMKLDLRSNFKNVINNPAVFPPELIYRPADPAFGLQTQVKILAYAGLETKEIAEYVAKSAKWHKRRKYKTGNIKAAVAKTPGTNDIVYEIVYLEIIDPQDSILDKTQKIINITTNTVNPLTADIATAQPEVINIVKADSDAVPVNGTGNVRYLSNITNMQEELRNVGATQYRFLPLWMRTPQAAGEQESGFVLAAPLCYCKPGASQQILTNLKNNSYDFKDLSIELDRYIIDSTVGNSNEQYILFANYNYNT
jgi:hypothetical protein